MPIRDIQRDADGTQEPEVRSLLRGIVHVRFCHGLVLFSLIPMARLALSLTTPFLLKTRRTVPLVPRKLRPNRGIANPV
jgi:hypothetical protein